MVTEATIAEAKPVSTAPSPLSEFWGSFRENPGAVAGLIILTIIALLAIFADLIAPYSPYEQYRDAVKLPPAFVEGGRAAFRWAPMRSVVIRSRASFTAPASRSSSASPW